MTIIDRIVESKYIATVENVEALTREHIAAMDSANLTGRTYLHILIACTQKRVSIGPSRRKINALDALEAISKELYPAVIKAASEGSESTAETNRRATFARTNKSTLVAYLRAGKPLADLKPGETSKRQLRAAIQPPPPEDRTIRIIEHSRDSILRAVEREAKRDLDTARRNLERLIDELVTKLDDLKDDEVGVVDTKLTRREYPPRVQHHN